MAAQLDIIHIPLIPVVICDEDGAFPNIVYICIQGNQQPISTGADLMLEIQKHTTATRTSRFAKRCALKHRTVSVCQLETAPQGSRLSPPIYDALFTRALKKPTVLRSVTATQLIGTNEVLIIEWQSNEEARVMIAKLARVAVRAGVVALSILNFIGI